MPDLFYTLQGHDLGFLKIVALLWGVEVTDRDVHSMLPALTREMLNADLLMEIVDSLPASARSALQALTKNQGRLPWSLFTRRFGVVRPMGAARRDRERPHLNPESPTETLWYRGLIGKAFLNLPPEPQEYAYIPDDLATLLDLPSQPQPLVLGRAALAAECAYPLPASDDVLDDACTLLAALRMGLDESRAAAYLHVPANALEALLHAAGLLDDERTPNPQAVREFLETPRSAALTRLVQVWRTSTAFNELRLLPGLICEGEWHNDPLVARTALLEMLGRIPTGVWWNLPEFIAAVKENNPDFQRPAGDYDSWFIRRAVDGEYLRGFNLWDEVDGALLVYQIRGTLHWLGLLDLAAPQSGAETVAFRFSEQADKLLAGQAPPETVSEDGLIHVSSEGVVRAGRRAPRWLRYQLARFGKWLPLADDEYRYQITPLTLAAAQKQGLRGTHLINLLRKHAAPPLPSALLTAIERWEQNGVQARLENATLLRVISPDLLTALRKTPAGRYILEELSPTCALVRANGKRQLLRELARLGVLGEDDTEAV